MVSWPLPVKTADGTISPNTSTSVTEMMTASQDGTTRSRKSGSVSLAAELSSSRVTSSRWWRRTRGSSRSACCLSRMSCSRSSSVSQSSTSVSSMTCRSKGSMDTKPTVSPAARAATITQPTAQPRDTSQVGDQTGASCVTATAASRTRGGECALCDGMESQRGSERRMSS